MDSEVPATMADGNRKGTPMDQWVSVQAAGIGVVTGVFVGAIAAIRRQPAVQYAAHASVNASIIAAVYLGIRKSLLSNQLNHKRQMFPMDASMASGGVTGSIIGAIQTRDLRVACVWALLGGAVGATGQYSYDAFDRWRLKQIILRKYPEQFAQQSNQDEGGFIGSLETANRHPRLWSPFIIPGTNDYRVHLNRALVQVYEDLVAVTDEITQLRQELGLPSDATEEEK